MRIIELLNDLSTGKDIPKKIQVGEHTYKLVNEEELYYETEDNGRLNFDWFIETRKLNDDEIIILDKELYRLDYCEEHTFSKIETPSYLTDEERRLLDSNFKTLGDKINDIIDKIKELEN